jgi:pimeloyl-ACP methyl ester carboxylesterase
VPARATLWPVAWVDVGEVRLWCAVDGPSGAPGVLLIGGHGTQGIEWPDELVAALVAAGRRVVRYDHRDAGASTDCTAMWDAGRHYSLSDLAADGAQLVRALDLSPVHVVGYSLGGVVAQLLALAEPALVSGLTLLSSSPAGRGLGIEPPWPRYDAVLRPAPGPLPADRVAYLLRLWGAMAGHGYPLDLPAATRLAERVVARGWDANRIRRQLFAAFGVVDDPPDVAPLAVTASGVPVLVVHGDDDPVLPHAHGVALADELGARLVTVPGLGHQLDAGVLVGLVPAIVGT